MATAKSSKAVAAASSTAAAASPPDTATPPGTGSSTGSSASGTTPVATKAPTGLRLKVQQMLAGISAVLPDGSTLLAPGAPLAKADIVTQLQGYLAEFAAVDSQELALKQVRSQLTAAEPAIRPYLQTLKNALVALFGTGSPQLAQFGVSAKVRRKATAKEIVASTAKSAETRQIRGTTSTKQKAALQFLGTVAVGTTPIPGGTAAPVTPAASGGAETPAAPAAATGK